MCSVYYEGLIACFHPPLHTAVDTPVKLSILKPKTFTFCILLYDLRTYTVLTKRCYHDTNPIASQLSGKQAWLHT